MTHCYSWDIFLILIDNITNFITMFDCLVKLLQSSLRRFLDSGLLWDFPLLDLFSVSSNVLMLD
jgi:hypothetical protein